MSLKTLNHTKFGAITAVLAAAFALGATASAKTQPYY